MGNKDLKPETSNNLNLSVDFDSKKVNITAMTQLSSARDNIAFRWTAASDTIRYVNFNGNTEIVSSEISATYHPTKAFHFKGSYAYYYISNSTGENRPHTFTVKAEYIPKRDALYIPNVVLSGKYLQLFSKLPYHLTFTAGIDNLFDYVTKTTSFYSSISPGRTYLIGLKWTY